MINILTSMLVAVLSLYVFRAADSRAEARAALEIVEALPGQIAVTPAMAAGRRREWPALSSRMHGPASVEP